ncbi:MAG: glycosyl hydrolase family 88 [Oscillospiraceae bacterium]|nr:glycosyl hydrolase family 88 [Oscillospiraceae bacterium]
MNRKRPKRKTPSTKRKLFAALSLSAVVIALAAVFLFGGNKPENRGPGLFDVKISALEDCIFLSGKDLSGDIAYDTGEYGYIVFISVCDSKTKAAVFHAAGKTLESAYNSAARTAKEFVSKNGYEALLVKADVVNDISVIASDSFESVIAPYASKFFRKGIAFDRAFKCALLEAEINANTLISYDNNKINVNNIKKYSEDRNEGGLFKGVPDELFLFTTTGWICDEKNDVFRLHSDETNFGRRVTGAADDDLAFETVTSASEFLKSMVKDDGEFIYGYRPATGQTISGYNILRHAGTVWCMINQYRLTGDESLIPLIEKLLFYLEACAEQDAPDTAYIVERKADEIKLGGNALAVLAFISYMETFESDNYMSLTEKLANGILALCDVETGTYYHVLNFPGFTKKEEYRTVYYDGEATYALARAYALTNEDKYLEAAKAAVFNFIENEYEQYRDHWVAYSVNEVTKHFPDERFLTFGLKNANVNLRRIYRLDPGYSTSFELLMASFEIYDRVIKNHGGLEYLNEFDKDGFFETIYYRAEHMLNARFYPEFAMYMHDPSLIADSFFVRRDNFRVRIDDVQHVIGGYHKYIDNYTALKAYG